MSSIVSRTIEVCIFRVRGAFPEYLVLKRSADEALYPGMWQFVTGTMREKERAIDAALREFREETGLTAVRYWVVPFVSSFFVPSDDTVHLSPVFAIEVDAGEELRLSDEHERSAWCSLDDAREKLVWPTQRHALQLVHEYILGGQEAARLLSLPV